MLIFIFFTWAAHCLTSDQARGGAKHSPLKNVSFWLIKIFRDLQWDARQIWRFMCYSTLANRIQVFCLLAVRGECFAPFKNTKALLETHLISGLLALKIWANWHSSIVLLRILSNFFEIDNEMHVKFEELCVIVPLQIEFKFFVFWLSGESASHHIPIKLYQFWKNCFF